MTGRNSYINMERNQKYNTWISNVARVGNIGINRERTLTTSSFLGYKTLLFCIRRKEVPKFYGSRNCHLGFM
jgi:hypothetical protein